MPRVSEQSYAGGILEVSYAGRWVITPVREWRYRGVSPYQQIDIGEVPYLGTALFLDGWLQLAEADEYIYHEHLVLPALLAHPAPRRVLILGGGDGLAAREVWRRPDVEHLTLVDLDAQVVEACRTHLAHLQQGALDDPRLHLVIGDARDFLREATQPFDVILVDLIDLMPDTVPLFEDVFQHVKQALHPQGLVVVHAPDPGPPLYEGLFMVAFMRRYFPHVVWYKAFISSFGETWSFAIGSFQQRPDLLTADEWKKRGERLTTPPRSFVPYALPGYFLHPEAEEERINAILSGDFTPSLEEWPAVLLSADEMEQLTQLITREAT